MRLPHLRLRTLLIAVAVAGLALGGWQMWKRREYCLLLAGLCTIDERYYLRRAERLDEDASAELQRAAEARGELASLDERGHPLLTSAIRRTIAELGGHAAELKNQAKAALIEADRASGMARGYRHVARHPWLPLPIEPPRHIAAPPPPE